MSSRCASPVGKIRILEFYPVPILPVSVKVGLSSILEPLLSIHHLKCYCFLGLVQGNSIQLLQGNEKGVRTDKKSSLRWYMVVVTDYGRMMAKSLILCSPNSYPKPK